jgi:hypothetical protein
MTELQMLQILAATVTLHLDSNQTAMLDRQLKYVEAQTYDIEYPALMHRTFIPTDNSVPEGAETIAYEMFDKVGRAGLIANYADDLPGVDVIASEFNIPVKGIGVHFKYSLRDLQRAAFSGVPLDTKRGQVARDAAEFELDDIACFGRPQVGIHGFLNNSFVTIESAGGVWSGRTAEQICADVAVLVGGIIADTNQIHKATDIVFPTELWNLISMRPFSATGGSNYTIRRWLEENHPGVSFSTWTQLDLANADGDGGRIVAYKKSPSVLQEKVPMEFRQLPPQPKNLSFIVNCWALTAGTHVYQPGAVRYMDGAN